ncbi:MAG TPA: Ig-like domain-containing protein [Sediminibacterium sp.]|uniref:Ig-like domain-containing protein n=1 Tax=Sediminibacterium sp. TaxID=1917865 RepID=UPI000B18CAF4|nr:Ig-like domain-containing protein [Sediminibacterium sp.]HLD51740.1 Ig-like domain-containing protein [Sediminibacterium sp.]
MKHIFTFLPKRLKALFSPTIKLLLVTLLFSMGCKKGIEETGTIAICPEVVSTDPVAGAINVPTIKVIAATFNEPMNPATINNSTFLLQEGTVLVSGAVSYTGSTASFTPSVPLKSNTVYTATITTGAKDNLKSSMIQNYVWSFNTGAVPTVVSTDPVNDAANVALIKNVSATFSTAMNPATITSSSFILKQGVNVIAGGVTYSGTTAVFTPVASFLENTVYTATIVKTSKDLAGNAMVADYTWSFATGTIPIVVSTSPVNGAADVVLNKVVTASFSKVMNPATMDRTTFLLSNGTTPVLGDVTYTGNTASFKPVVNLLPNTLYTGTITTGVRDSSGNALASNYTWTFRTGVLLDIIKPLVVSTDPINGAFNVPLNKVITATFSENMDLSSINNTTFLVKNGTATIPGTITYTGKVASFVPTGGLASNTLYTGTITIGARDISGNTLASDYTWTFTTIPPVVIPPVISPTLIVFGVFGGNAGITNQGLNTVINNGGIGTTAASTLITGFHDMITGDVYTETPLNVGRVNGRIHTAPPAPGSAASAIIAAQGLADANALYLSTAPAAKPGGIDPGAGELGGLTLAPGVYKSASGTFKISNGNLTLDAKGDPNAVWVFQTASGLTVGIAGPTGAKSVIMINGGQPKNVFWHVGSAATINGAGGGTMVGTIIAYAGVTFSTPGNATQTILNGRALSLNASVTMVNTTINVQ